MCEVLYLYGVLLTLMDSKIEGSVRERIVIACEPGAPPVGVCGAPSHPPLARVPRTGNRPGAGEWSLRFGPCR